MPRNFSLPFMLVNVAISIVVALIVIAIFLSLQKDEDTSQAHTPAIIYLTVTPDPGMLPPQALQATIDTQALTIAALQRSGSEGVSADNSGSANGAIPTQPDSPLIEETATLPTIDPTVLAGLNLPQENTAASIVLSSPYPEDGCQRYTVVAGDTGSSIATQLGVALTDLFRLNGINDRTILQIGDVLLVPGTDCFPEITPTATATPAPTFNLTFVAPTTTLVPTAENSQLTITRINNMGDVTAEQIEIQNLGGEIDLEGWTLSDSNDHVFTFPSVRFVPGGIIRILTGTGENTPGFLYWNLEEAVWESGDMATLKNAEGVVQITYTVP